METLSQICQCFTLPRAHRSEAGIQECRGGEGGLSEEAQAGVQYREEDSDQKK